MQSQGRWRKSVRAIIAVNSMRPSSRKPPSVAAVDEEQEELEEPPPGQAWPHHIMQALTITLPYWDDLLFREMFLASLLLKRRPCISATLIL